MFVLVIKPITTNFFDFCTTVEVCKYPIRLKKPMLRFSFCPRLRAWYSAVHAYSTLFQIQHFIFPDYISRSTDIDGSLLLKDGIPSLGQEDYWWRKWGITAKLQKEEKGKQYLYFLYIFKKVFRYSLYFADKSQFVKSVANTFSYKRKREKKMFLHFWWRIVVSCRLAVY